MRPLTLVSSILPFFLAVNNNTSTTGRNRTVSVDKTEREAFPLYQSRTCQKFIFCATDKRRQTLPNANQPSNRIHRPRESSLEFDSTAPEFSYYGFNNVILQFWREILTGSSTLVVWLGFERSSSEAGVFHPVPASFNGDFSLIHLVRCVRH